MTKSSLTKNILVFSDVHLNHKKTNTRFIIENIKTYIHEVINKESIDCVFIAGDLFDSLMYLNSIELSPIIAWIDTFLTLCSERGTSVRVLEGTPSHDWRQSRLFNSIISVNPHLKNKLDFAYHDDLTIEHVSKLGMNVLYIPDEYGLTAEYTFDAVLKKLKEHNLSKVDLVIMHGLFDFQELGTNGIPKSKSTHQSINYLNICNRYIFVGHSHIHTFYKRILVEGSFDRLAHGEESSKGFIVAKLDNDPENDEFYFVENKGAKIYKTIEARNDDIDKFRKLIERHVAKHPVGSHFRILIRNTFSIYPNVDLVFKDYPDYYFTKKPIDTKKEETISKIDKVKSTGITINKNTLKGIVVDKINTYKSDPIIKELALKQLEEFL
jgi:UDP-2,3-diacylglucosamine pyrophosphatase LpxH